jgi:hypothetical protein
MDVLEVARFNTLPEAELAVALLRREGIDARLPDRETANTLAHIQLGLGGLRVLAPADQIAKARRILADADAGAFQADGSEDAGDWRQDETPGRIGELEDEQITAPVSWGKALAIVLGLLFLVSFLPGACAEHLRGY